MKNKKYARGFLNVAIVSYWLHKGSDDESKRLFAIERLKPGVVRNILRFLGEDFGGKLFLSAI